MAQPTLGEIRLFAPNFAPRGWAFCQGQLLTISSNQALYSLLGTIYGGDGRTTFGLPDLRGRASIGTGRGPGLSNIILGQRLGSEQTTLNADNLASHNHVTTTSNVHAIMTVGDDIPDSTNPDGNYLTQQSSNFFASASSEGQYLQQGAEVKYEAVIHSNGLSKPSPVNIMGPSLALNYIIAIVGQYPTRS